MKRNRQSYTVLGIIRIENIVEAITAHAGSPQALDLWRAQGSVLLETADELRDGSNDTRSIYPQLRCSRVQGGQHS